MGSAADKKRTSLNGLHTQSDPYTRGLGFLIRPSGTGEVASSTSLSSLWAVSRRTPEAGLVAVPSVVTFRPDGNRIRELLDATDVPQLHYILVTAPAADSATVTTWLPAAARRLAGGLVYHNHNMARRGGNDVVQLPCFENATTIELHLRCCLALPSLGVFTQLTDLDLRYVDFRGPCELGDLVSSPRCPCLQKLSICYALGLGNLSIHSDTLLQINLMFCNLRRQLTIVTPLLQKLSVHDFFHKLIEIEQQGANITAPETVSLVWNDQYDPRYFHLGQPRKLKTGPFYVYGQETCRECNHTCLRLLQQFKVLDTLHLPLIYLTPSTCHYEYLLGDITALPQITFLRLDLDTNGHAFGASVFHLLRMCMGLRRLSLVLGRRSSLVSKACPSGCICGQPRNWKTDELVLDHLEDVRIIGLRGAEHEAAFLQRFLGWATVLKSLRITLANEMTEGKIGEFREAFAGSVRPETCVQFETSDSK